MEESGAEMRFSSGFGIYSFQKSALHNTLTAQPPDESSSLSLEGQRRRVTRGNDEESCGATSLPIGKVLANSALVAPKAV